jgi:uncharacterized membrane protein (UPF0136 family)
MTARVYSGRDTLAPTLALFTSVGTLVCCALPALLVTLGMGAALAGLVGVAPQLVWLSEHKGLVFGASGALILVSAALQVRAARLPCPADKAQAAACARLRRFSAIATGLAAAVWAIGFFFAFLAVYLFF